jgi:phosphoserine phosphatase
MTDHVLTLLARRKGALDPAFIDRLAQTLDRLGAGLGTADWLAPGLAVDLPFADLNADQAEAAARRSIGRRKIDVIAQPSGLRRKRILVADMESTLIVNEMLDELADLVGKRTEIAGITARAMNGELDFEGALDARVALIAGLSVADLERVATRIEIMPGARALIATMRGAGAGTYLVSGGFRFFTRMIAERLGIEREAGNDLEIENGRLTGRVLRPILGRAAKREALLAAAAERLQPIEATLAVGDGANDLDMILAAGLGIAFRAKPMVAARARWRIDHGDLTALLYAQGYRRDEFRVS